MYVGYAVLLFLGAVDLPASDWTVAAHGYCGSPCSGTV